MGSWVFFFAITATLISLSKSLENMPYLEEQWTISVPISASLGTDACLQIESNSDRIFRLGKSGVLNSWLKDGSGYLEHTTHETDPWTETLQSFNLITNQSQILFGKHLSSNFWVLDSATLLESEALGYSDGTNNTSTVEVNGYMVSSRSSDLSTPFATVASHTRSGGTFSISSSTSSSLGLGTTVYSKADPTDTYALLFTSAGSYGIYDPTNMSPAKLFTFQFLALTTPVDAEFSPDGSRLALEFDDLADLVVIEMTTFSTVASLSVGSVVHSIEFVSNSILAVFHDSSISYYDVDTLSLHFSKSSSVTQDFLSADFANKRVYECTPGFIKVHTLKCPSLHYFSNDSTLECASITPIENCLSYDMQTGLCSSCGQSLTVSSSGQCEEAVSSNGTDYSCAEDENCKVCSGELCQQCHEGFYLEGNSLCSELPLSAVIEIGVSGLELIGPIITFVMVLIQTVPLVSLFLQFVNYWNLACLYELLDTPTPSFLSQTNALVFKSINFEYSELLGLENPVGRLSSQEVSDPKLAAYSVEVDFVRPNSENIIYLLCLSCVTLTACYVRRFASRQSYWSKVLRLDKLDILAGQAIGMTSVYLLPQTQVFQTLHFATFSAKVNSGLQIAFTAGVCFLPLLYLFLLIPKHRVREAHFNIKLKKCSKSETSAEKIKEMRRKAKALKQQHRESEGKNFWLYVVNVSTPIFVMLPSGIPFLVVNMGVLCLILYYTTKETSYTVNSTILSLYFVLFHVCYSVIYCAESEMVDHYAGVSCLVVFVLGGAHELLSLVFISIYEFVRWVRPFYQKAKKRYSDSLKVRKTNKRRTLTKSNHNIDRQVSFLRQQRRKNCQKSMKHFRKQIQHTKPQISEAPDQQSQRQTVPGLSDKVCQNSSIFASSKGRVGDESTLLKNLKRKNSDESQIFTNPSGHIDKIQLKNQAQERRRIILKKKVSKQKFVGKEGLRVNTIKKGQKKQKEKD